MENWERVLAIAEPLEKNISLHDVDYVTQTIVLLLNASHGVQSVILTPLPDLMGKVRCS